MGHATSCRRSHAIFTLARFALTGGGRAADTHTHTHTQVNKQSIKQEMALEHRQRATFRRLIQLLGEKPSH
jgi:hypothetical protein